MACTASASTWSNTECNIALIPPQACLQCSFFEWVVEDFSRNHVERTDGGRTWAALGSGMGSIPWLWARAARISSSSVWATRRSARIVARAAAPP